METVNFAIELDLKVEIIKSYQELIVKSEIFVKF